MNYYLPSTASAYERRQRWTRNGTQTYTARGIRGIARRSAGCREHLVKCEHVHTKRSAALTCAEALAKSLNKSLDNPA